MTFAACFAPEILTTSIVPIAAGGIAAAGAGSDVPAALVVMAAVWYGSEAVLARSSGWRLTFASPVAWVVRDLLIPVFWVAAWTGNSFNWRGNEMSATRASLIVVDADTAAAKST